MAWQAPGEEGVGGYGYGNTDGRRGVCDVDLALLGLVPQPAFNLVAVGLLYQGTHRAHCRALSAADARCTKEGEGV
jgi:hypothetical protein